jgi:hypothetical protein
MSLSSNLKEMISITEIETKTKQQQINTPVGVGKGVRCANPSVNTKLLCCDDSLGAGI